MGGSVTMLIELTLKCTYECPHCFVEADRNGANMSLETAVQVAEFLKEVQPPVIQLTGGEFTQHPQFYQICKSLINAVSCYGGQVLLESNGSFKDNNSTIEEVIALLKEECVHGLQIRTDKHYYPHYQETLSDRILRELPKTKVYDGGIDLLYPLGRAVKNYPDKINRTCYPSCINVFLYSRQCPESDLRELIHYLQIVRGKFCKPTIDVNGYLHAGEAWQCVNFGHVSDGSDKLFKKILEEKPCNKCGLVGNLPPEAKEIIGI